MSKRDKFAVGHRRLLQLARFLDKLPPKRFDYSQIVGDDWKGKADLSCGTVACAIGWATTIPSFAKAGLRLNSGWIEGAAGRTRTTTSAGTALFEINDVEWNYLFDPNDNGVSERASAKRVAKHIREFVAERKKTQEQMVGGLAW